MGKRLFQKGNLSRADFHRSLLTDTTPEELPIIVSNDGFYTNVKNLDKRSNDTQRLIREILNPSTTKHSIPFRYRVTKDSTSTRRLSLIHPSAQFAVSEFYREYSQLICYYNSLSPFSIRAPVKQGSSYFFRSTVSEKNKYKREAVDTLQFDKRVRNPASFFAYKGHERKYRFFESVAYSRLEKKFPIMWMADVSKCFDSIYTHSITWAVKDMELSKSSTSKRSFGGEFDFLMQSMNYRETNGICIGPEVCRIFAETIFQKIDANVERSAKKAGFIFRKHYECVRYVDDIIIFAQNDDTAKAIYAIFERELGQFNLHLNDQKLTRYARPFQTDKSWIIHELLKKLHQFQEQVSKTVAYPDGKRILPNHLFRPRALRLRFLAEIKSVCRLIGVGYDQVSNYLISSLSNLLENVVESYSGIPAEDRPTNSDYVTAIALLLDLIFHFYTMHPTVQSSFRVSKAIVIGLSFIESIDPRRKTYVFEQLMGWLVDLVRSFEAGTQKLVTERVPVEVINVALALASHDDGEHLSEEFVRDSLFQEGRLEYFATVSLIFFAGDKPQYKKLIQRVQTKIRGKLNSGFDVRSSAHDAHLMLDLVCCPHIDKSLRMDLVRRIWLQFGFGPIGVKRLNVIVSEMESEHWFVKWTGIDLLNMIKRKELSHVY